MKLSMRQKVTTTKKIIAIGACGEDGVLDTGLSVIPVIQDIYLLITLLVDGDVLTDLCIISKYFINLNSYLIT